MTLVAPKKRLAHHKKVSGRHHRQTKSYHKPYWPYLPLIAVVVAGALLNSLWPSKHSVLGYATDMSIQSLLDNTNAQRSSNGLGVLAQNAQLNQAAQAKANDMISRDYWSHNTPDGQPPWVFITATGYSYQTAGENLAYGFDTAANTVTGWMNSPGHRANILNTSYQEVGFGFANGSNYQSSGPQTVVVAMYAKPTTPLAAAPTPAPVSTPVATATPTTVSGSAAQAQGGTPAAASPTPVAEDTPLVTSATPTETKTPIKTAPEVAPEKISRVQLLTAGNASWSLAAMSLVAIGALGVFLFRHGLAWHKVLRRGERFILKHKWLDIGVVTLIVLAIILSQTGGSIR